MHVAFGRRIGGLTTASSAGVIDRVPIPSMGARGAHAERWSAREITVVLP
jgi:hypothetical protein